MQNSKIEWCHHTFNAWEGCEKVSAGCANCYAERRDKQYHGGEHWGPSGTRKMMSETYWKQPLKWNRDAEKTGVRPRVFCSSLADWLEDRPELVQPRARLLQMASMTPNLDWLFLSKRVEGWRERMQEVVAYWRRQPHGSCNFMADDLERWIEGEVVLSNIWLGTSVENQEQADKRIPELLRIPASVRFLSCEPLLELVDLKSALLTFHCGGCARYSVKSEDGQSWKCDRCKDRYFQRFREEVDWVIVGGESGPNARPMHPEWARSLRDQCIAAGVAFHFKQWGEWIDNYNVDCDWWNNGGFDKVKDSTNVGNFTMHKIGKHATGRMLDGRTWDGFPEAGGR